MPAMTGRQYRRFFWWQRQIHALGTLVDAILIGVLENGLVTLSLPYYAVNIIKGAVLALALTFTHMRNKSH